MGAIEGGVVGVLTKRLFEGVVDETILDWSVATLAAAQGFANISSFFWAAVSHGKHKVKFVTALKVMCVLLVGLVTITPTTPFGLGMLLCCVIGTRICYTGVVTLRTTIWQANYPREKRANVAGAIATIQSLVLASVAFGVGQAMDHNEVAFRWIYPIASSFGLIGAAIYSKILVKGHKQLLHEEKQCPELVSIKPWKTFHLLFEDVQFAKYMTCQFILGVGNLMLTAPLVIVLNDDFALDYLGEILIVTIIPILMIPISTPLWAKFLNRVHILTFRSFHSWFFVISSLCFAAGIFMRDMNLMWTGAAIRGLGFGGGVLAWNLGHQDYAPVEQSGQYMGLHVTLTGIRGLFAPALGVFLYTSLFSNSYLSGAIVFVIGATFSAIGGIGFIVLARTRKS